MRWKARRKFGRVSQSGRRPSPANWRASRYSAGPLGANPWIRATISGRMLSAPFSTMCGTMRAPTAATGLGGELGLVLAPTQSIEAWRFSLSCWKCGDHVAGDQLVGPLGGLPVAPSCGPSAGSSRSRRSPRPIARCARSRRRACRSPPGRASIMASTGSPAPSGTIGRLAISRK